MSENQSLVFNEVQEKEFHIVMCTDKRYVPFLAVALYSIGVHARTPKVKYNIHILHAVGAKSVPEVEQSEMNFLSSVVAFNPQIRLNFCALSGLDLDSIQAKRINATVHVSNAAFLRLMIPYLFEQTPEFQNIDKCLYLDCDLVTTIDPYLISRYDSLLEDKILAGVQDYLFNSFIDASDMDVEVLYNCYDAARKNYTNLQPHCEKVLGIKDSSDYINSGVIYFNIKRMKELGICHRFASGLSEFPEVPIFLDQDIINYFANLFGGALRLPSRFNCRAYNSEYLYYQFNNRKVQDVDGLINRDTLVQFLGNSVAQYCANLPNLNGIHHFTTFHKPWVDKLIAESQIWWGCVAAMPNAQSYFDSFGADLNFTEDERKVFDYLGKTYFTTDVPSPAEISDPERYSFEEVVAKWVELYGEEPIMD